MTTYSTAPTSQDQTQPLEIPRPVGSAAPEEHLADARQRLVEHPVYAAVDSPERLRAFMEWHVFAVWDFMSMTKRLQREFSCVELPWMPPENPRLARFVNEIVLDEESDVGPDGEPASHLQMYLRAMDEVGADAEPFRSFLDAVAAGSTPERALFDCGAPHWVRHFVARTLETAQHGTTGEVAAWFAFGREDVIPDMFTRLLENGDVQNAPWFRFYLERHVELDGGEHGDLARELVEAAREDQGLDVIGAAGRDAIEARIALWDGVFEALTGTASTARQR